MNKPHIFELEPSELIEILSHICDKTYKIKQILRWIYLHYTIDMAKMTDLSVELREKLSSQFDCSLPEIVNIAESSDKSIKFLLKLRDSSLIEMVVIPTEKKNTICISTQVGCARNCSFCATAKLRFKRNLSIDELFAQIFLGVNHLKNEKISNIVLMGMGEPLDNYDTVVKFIKIITSNDAFDFSARKITISTCGITPKILSLAELNTKFKLAISLNSAINKKRTQLMPINEIYNLSELKKAVMYFRRNSSFRVTFEYIMIKDFNMAKEDIIALKKFCSDISCKINLIKWNYVPGIAWKSPSEEEINIFVEDLKSLPVAITYRRSRGEDIGGACGQLSGQFI